MWLLARGWPAAQVAEAHTIGDWLEHFRQQGSGGMTFEQNGGSPPSSTQRNKRR
jgi:hypothetical protein